MPRNLRRYHVESPTGAVALRRKDCRKRYMKRLLQGPLQGTQNTKTKHGTNIKRKSQYCSIEPDLSHTPVAQMSTGDSSHLRGPALSPHGRRLPVRFGATRTHSHTLGAHDLRMLEHGVGCAYRVRRQGGMWRSYALLAQDCHFRAGRHDRAY